VKRMIINNSIQAGVAGVYASQQTSVRKTTGTAAAVSSKDEIVLSSQAQSFSAALQKAKDASTDVRQDKVVFYENQIAAGTYNVDAQALAAKMLQTRY